jgi:hypothetical protein
MISLNEIPVSKSISPRTWHRRRYYLARPSSRSSQFEWDQSVGNPFRIYLVHEDFFISRELVRTIADWHSRWEH